MKIYPSCNCHKAFISLQLQSRPGASQHHSCFAACSCVNAFCHRRLQARIAVWRTWKGGLQLEVAKRIVTVARQVVFTKVLLFLFFPELQLDIAKRTVLAAHGEKNGVAESAEEVAGRKLRAEVAQKSGCPEKRSS